MVARLAVESVVWVVVKMVVPSHFDCHKNTAGIEFLAPVTL